MAIKIDGKIKFLIEVKAIGLDLKEDHIKQAVDYGSNAGVDWVILTNGSSWKIYKIIFSKPVEHELVYEFDIINLNAKKDSDIEMIYYVSKESLGKSLLEDFHNQKQILNRFFIGQIILSEPVLDAIRKTIRKVAQDVKCSNEELEELINREVLKREILEGDKAEESKKKINKAFKALEKKESNKAEEKNHSNSEPHMSNNN